MTLPRRRAWAWISLAGVLLVALLAVIEVRVVEPRVAVRWDARIDPAERTALERRYTLRNGERDQGTSWRYDLGNRSRDNIRALIREHADDEQRGEREIAPGPVARCARGPQQNPAAEATRTPCFSRMAPR